MKYQPSSATWEVTMGCNMRCGHCGSSCAEALPDELTSAEAFTLIDEIAALKLKWITLSGGEPLTRDDLPKLIKRLSSSGVLVNIITNGWLLSRNTADMIKRCGISTVGISVDGTEEIHDRIRKQGSFSRLQKAFEHLNDAGVHKSAITTVSKNNIDNLPELRKTLIKMNVDAWQVQLGLPMGNFKEHQDWLLEPEQMDDMIDFCYETSRMNQIRIYPADSIGYYTKKELQTKRHSFQSEKVPLWSGCGAGIRSFGILHNGNIVGCTSIREPEFIEGNIKNTRLREIWNHPDSFAWRRTFTKSDLQGNCSACVYGEKCLGGCPDVRLTINGSIYSENRYCSYHGALEQLKLFSGC